LSWALWQSKLECLLSLCVTLRHLRPSLMFVGKARRLQLDGAIERKYTNVGLDLLAVLETYYDHHMMIIISDT
jgi:hypothetical protein